MTDRIMARDRAPVQVVAMLLGATFLLVGILGFIPGITTHYGDMKFAGEGSNSQLLGVFQVSILHNVLYLVLGIAGLWLARTWAGARTYLLGGGALYLALWVLGLLGGANWIPSDSADDWLHFALGAGMLGLAFVTTRGAQRDVAVGPA